LAARQKVLIQDKRKRCRHSEKIEIGGRKLQKVLRRNENACERVGVR
jgi:hypothetical protein